MIKNWEQYNENNNEQELETMFNLVIGDIEVFKIPYSYYGGSADFYIYVISGVRYESDDHKLVQELYHNHNILNKMYNLEFFNITLTKKYATVVLYDYITTYDKYSKNYLSSIPESKLTLPENIKSRLDFSKTLSMFRGGNDLHRGIRWSDGGGSNLALYPRIYEKPEKK